MFFTRLLFFFHFRRLSTVAPFTTNSSNSSNVTHARPIPTQQTSDTFLFQDAVVPPDHQDMYVSPFSKPQFKEQLLPIIGAKVREQFEGFLEDVDDGIDFIKNIFTAKQKVVKNLAFKVKNRLPLVPPLIPVPSYQLDPRQKYKIPDFTPTITTRIRINTKKPYYRYAKTGAISHTCDDPIKCEQKQWFKYPNEIVTDGIKELEDSVLKKLEKIEEKKVEATLGLLVNKRESDVIKGKPYGFHNEWKPVSYHNQYLDAKGSGSGKVYSHLNTSFKGTSAPVTVVNPAEPYPISKKHYKKVKNYQKTQNVKIYPSSTKRPAYGSIQEIIASTAGTGYHQSEPLYNNHVTHLKPETGFTPILYRPSGDSDINASKNNEISMKTEKKTTFQKKRKVNPSRTTPKPTTTTTTSEISNTTSTRNSPFRWPKVSSSETASSPSESKVSKVFVSSGQKPSTTRSQVKRPLAERLVSTASDTLPAVTRSPFVDKVRKSGYRGRVKFNSVLNETN